MATTMASEVATKLPNFTKGLKKVYLPRHVVTLIRKENQPPDWATFRVPLRFNKFDMRDYMFHLYGVETTKVRAFIKRQFRPRKNDRGIITRPAPEKYMTVTLTEPFVWPDPPTDLAPWDKALFQAREKAMEKDMKVREAMQVKAQVPELNKQPLDRAAKAIKERARKLLTGEEKWDNGIKLDEKWEKIVAEKAAWKARFEEARAPAGTKPKDEVVAEMDVEAKPEGRKE